MTQKKHPVLSAFGVVFLAGVILVALFMVTVRFLGTPIAWKPADRIGVITVKGPISESKQIISQIVEFRKNDRVKAIVLKIDSPGGSVGPTQEIYREIRKTIDVKPVVASIEATAASGGYYVASAAGRIFANPGSITGSIGVVMEFIRIDDLLSKVGINFEVIKSGDFKDIGSPHRELTERERELLLELMLDIKNQFIAEVALGRNLPEDQVRELADGRIFSGAKAKELGLVDDLGNFRDAVDAAVDMAGLVGEIELVYPKVERFDILRLIREQIAGVLLELVRESSEGRLKYRWDGSAG